MSSFDFESPRGLAENLDGPLAAALPPVEQPVIVLGLHRSGTTFTYQLLADHFGFAVTTLYHITHYRRLLWAQAEGLTETYRQEVAARLAAGGIADRGIDGFAVGPDTLEEYAFILRKLAGTWGFTPRSRALFDEMLRKLAALQPDKPGPLLKNPHDLANASAIAAAYPRARFVFVRRDPVRVLNSQFRNSFLYRKQPEPYLNLLLAGVPAWQLAFRAMTVLNHAIPDAVYQAILVEGLQRSLKGQLARHYADLPHLEPSRYVELVYDELVSDPGPAIAAVAKLTGLAPRAEVRAIAATPRQEPLLDAVDRVAESFRRRLGEIPDARLRAPNA